MFFSSCRRRHRICSFGALNSVRGDLERPGQNKGDRQTDDDEQNNQSNDPVRNIEDRKNLRDSLRERPAGDDVSDRNLVNVAPLQLPEEVMDIHFSPVTFSASASKRGSPRSGSNSGSTLIQVIAEPS